MIQYFLRGDIPRYIRTVVENIRHKCWIVCHCCRVEYIHTGASQLNVRLMATHQYAAISSAYVELCIIVSISNRSYQKTRVESVRDATRSMFYIHEIVQHVNVLVNAQFSPKNKYPTKRPQNTAGIYSLLKAFPARTIFTVQISATNGFTN